MHEPQAGAGRELLEWADTRRKPDSGNKAMVNLKK
jgi:hypothetical protein